MYLQIKKERDSKKNTQETFKLKLKWFNGWNYSTVLAYKIT